MLYTQHKHLFACYQRPCTNISHIYQMENVLRDKIMGLECVKGGLSSSGDVKVQQCCYQVIYVCVHDYANITRIIVSFLSVAGLTIHAWTFRTCLSL